MSLRTFLKAALKLRNLALLALIVIVYGITSVIPFALIGAAGYLYFIMQTLKDEDFRKELEHEEKLEGIQKLNERCSRLYLSVLNKLPSLLRNRVRNVYKEKEELVVFFNQNSTDQLRQKIVEQALSLVIAYFKLIYNFSLKQKELNAINIDRVMERISTNNRKLSFFKNPKAVTDLQRAVELDEKLLERVKNEKSEIETISSRLEYIESAILMFKHQIVSRDDADPALTDIDNVVNEAMALDSVLTNRNEKLKL
ncbi:MAG: hypothetical protein ACOYWZ_20710 [Bacillota bacterium]